jgi:hypothetical protein
MMAEWIVICQRLSPLPQQHKHLSSSSFGEFNVINLVVQFDQLHASMCPSNPLEQSLSGCGIIKCLALLINGRDSLQRKHDSCWPRRSRWLPADFFSRLSILFNRRAPGARPFRGSECCSG